MEFGVVDVSRARFNGKPRDDTYIELPPERRRPGVCGLLVSNLYGTRGAAAAWGEHYVDAMEPWGFIRGIGSPCAFLRQEKSIDRPGAWRRLHDSSERRGHGLAHPQYEIAVGMQTSGSDRSGRNRPENPKGIKSTSGADGRRN